MYYCSLYWPRENFIRKISPVIIYLLVLLDNLIFGFLVFQEWGENSAEYREERRVILSGFCSQKVNGSKDNDDGGIAKHGGEGIWISVWQPSQYSCLENPLDRGACWATVYSVTKNGMIEAPEHAHTERGSMLSS